MSAGPAVRSLGQVPATPLGPGVTATEMLNDDHGCRGLHQRRLGFAGGARLAGTAGGRGEAWYVISGTGSLDTERTGPLALAPGTAVWLEPGPRLCLPGGRRARGAGGYAARGFGVRGAVASGGAAGGLRAGNHRGPGVPGTAQRGAHDHAVRRDDPAGPGAGPPPHLRRGGARAGRAGRGAPGRYRDPDRAGHLDLPAAAAAALPGEHRPGPLRVLGVFHPAGSPAAKQVS